MPKTYEAETGQNSPRGGTVLLQVLILALFCLFTVRLWYLQVHKGEHFAELARERGLSEDEKISLSKRAASLEVLIKAPARIQKIAVDIVEHFQSRVDPEGFKAMVVAYDKASCVAYKAELDRHLPPECSTGKRDRAGSEIRACHWSAEPNDQRGRKEGKTEPCALMTTGKSDRQPTRRKAGRPRHERRKD